MLYTVLSEGRTSTYVGIPWAPCGEWMPRLDGELSPCEHGYRGYHLYREADLIHQLGPVIYEAEYRGEFLAAKRHLVCREARLLRRLDAWNDATARLFSADCAERVLPIWERQYPEDSRPRDTIIAARAFARGEITQADRAVAYSAVYAAADSASTVADSAARAVADASTRASARAVADAVGDSAADSASAAASASASAVGDSAADSASAAAYWSAIAVAYRSASAMAYWSAIAVAGAAERAWQTTRLMQYLRGEVS
jgi:hypothetical protein